jgi:hypothetical protein
MENRGALFFLIHRRIPGHAPSSIDLRELTTEGFPERLASARVATDRHDYDPAHDTPRQEFPFHDQPYANRHN